MADIGGRARSGILWFTGLNLFQDLLQFAVMLVLVRLLEPRAYGESTLVNNLLGFLSVFSFRSFLEHALQVREPDEPDYQTHFAAGGRLQLAVFLAMNLAALGMRWIPEYSPAAPVAHWLSLYFLFDWGSELRVNMLERRMDWSRLRTLQAAGLALTAAASVALALAGAGTYALALPQLLRAAPPLWDLLVKARWRPTWKIDAGRHRETWRYGWTRITSGVAQRVQLLVEGAVIVGALGFGAYGMFGRATGLAAMACMKLSALLVAALFPVLARLEPATDRYRQAAALVLRAVAWTAAPAAGILALVAGPLVRLVYGEKWLPSAELLPLALMAATAGALAQASSLLLLAAKQQRRCMIADVAALTGSLLAISFALPHGAAAYLKAMTAVQCAVLALLLNWLIRGGAIAGAGIARALLPVALVAAVPATLAGRFDFAMLAATGPRAMLTILALSLTYLLALRLLAAASLEELVSQMPAASGWKKVFRFR